MQGTIEAWSKTDSTCVPFERSEHCQPDCGSRCLTLLGIKGDLKDQDVGVQIEVGRCREHCRDVFPLPCDPGVRFAVGGQGAGVAAERNPALAAKQSTNRAGALESGVPDTYSIRGYIQAYPYEPPGCEDPEGFISIWASVGTWFGEEEADDKIVAAAGVKLGLALRAMRPYLLIGAEGASLNAIEPRVGLGCEIRVLDRLRLDLGVDALIEENQVDSVAVRVGFLIPFGR